jgi:hypothetical protein
MFSTFFSFQNSLMLLYCISRTTRLSNNKPDGKDFKAHSSQQIHINSSESWLKGPVRCTPLIWSNFKHRIFVNDPVLSDLSSDVLASSTRPSTTSVP